jgi:superfamily II DNA or RNA helicase
MSNTNLTLRPHQSNALNILRRDWKKHDTHLMQAPTGAGKTAIAAEIVAGLQRNGIRSVFIAPYTALIDQTAKAFMDYGLPQPAIIWRDHPWYDPDNLIQIASADTLIRRDFPDCDVVIIDECHIKRAKLLKLMAEGDRKWIGLTATPFANWLGTYYDNFIKVTTMRQLIEQGFLSEYDIFAPTRPNLKGVKTSNLAAYGKDYVEDQLAEIMGDAQIVGNIIKTWLQNGENEPTIAFCVNVSHANFVTIAFCKAGVSAEVITADTPQEERQQIFKRFRTGVTKVMCNVGTLVAGLDEDVRCIIYARPTKSEARWIQCLGRGLRTAEGKDRCIILDHSGTVHRLGYPCSIEYDELVSDKDGLDEVKRQQKEKEKKEKQPKECPKCHYMKPAGQYVCARCGYKPINGEDVEVDESRELEIVKGKKKQYTKQEKQAFYSELLGYRNEARLNRGKNYSDGWISNQYKQKFGVWPKGLNGTVKAPSTETRNYIKSRMIAFAKGRK